MSDLADMLREFFARQREKLDTLHCNTTWRNGYREALKNVETTIAALFPDPPADVRCPGCGRSARVFCEIGCTICDCPIGPEIARLNRKLAPLVAEKGEKS